MRRALETAADLASFSVGLTALLAIGIPLSLAAYAGRLAVAAPLHLVATD